MITDGGVLYASLRQPLSESLGWDLHKAVQVERVTDIYKPIGAWKVEVNGTYAVIEDGSQTFIEYALPAHVPELMSQLVGYVNSIDIASLTLGNAHRCYATIHMGILHIHPFWDGNGRIARLLANIPLLKAGVPPLVIPQAQRREYIQTLANYQIVVGQLHKRFGVWPEPERLKEFEEFCDSAYASTKTLVESAVALQAERKRNSR